MVVPSLMSSSVFKGGAVVLLAVTCILIGCQPATGDGAVVGQVLEVTARSLVEVETLTIVTSDGKQWKFTGGEFPGFTPSHLEEHQALGEPVKVVYVREDDGSFRIVRIEDG